MKDYEQLPFIDKIRELERIEDESQSLKIESEDSLRQAFKLASDASEIKDMIELEMAKQDLADFQIKDKGVREILTKIRDNGRFHSITLYEKFQEMGDRGKEEKSNSLELNFFTSNFHELFDEFHSWFSVPDYYCRKLRIGPIVTSKSVPSRLSEYFSEIREAYSFGLDKSCISLCRALLEICLLEKLSKIEKPKKRDLSQDIYFARKYNLIDDDLKDRANEVRLKANSILHRNQKSDEISVFEIVKNTVRIVEHLYE